MILDRIRRSLLPAQPMPEDLHHNFVHLVMDIGWYGILNATTLAFLTIYVTRIHASSAQIGLMNAIPALMTMLLALPAGAYIEKRSLTRSALILGTVHRSFYFLLVLLPFIASQARQVNLLLIMTLVMYIPYSAFSLAFNTLFGASVPLEWRGYFAGARNAVFAVVTILVSLLSGYLLDVLPFPRGYQVVFGLGFVGAMMSTYHVIRVRVLPEAPVGGVESHIPEHRASLLQRIKQRMRTDVLKGRFLRVLLVLTAFHFTQFLPLSLFPTYYVNYLHLTDQVISIGTAIFYGVMFIGSTLHAPIVSRFGNRWVVGVGMLLLATYPGMLSMARGPSLYLLANVVSGLAWSLCGTAYFNYLLESVPAERRPAYLAWFNLLVNFGVLAGSLIGPVVGNWIGMVPALVLFTLFRAATGAAILRWG